MRSMYVYGLSKSGMDEIVTPPTSNMCPGCCINVSYVPLGEAIVGNQFYYLSLFSMGSKTLEIDRLPRSGIWISHYLQGEGATK